ncbi:hypothetical protein CHARACLAT_014313 [Characodon lateralis]|uniref:Uncharacterized protein n=1 Tax=Characodon lateralis TaxID=208331 RepID=A0ABU7DJ00_9TELE|nr:hypothetical protein [Characodon lateralis]
MQIKLWYLLIRQQISQSKVALRPLLLKHPAANKAIIVSLLEGHKTQTLVKSPAYISVNISIRIETTLLIQNLKLSYQLVRPSIDFLIDVKKMNLLFTFVSVAFLVHKVAFFLIKYGRTLHPSFPPLVSEVMPAAATNHCTATTINMTHLELLSQSPLVNHKRSARGGS